MTNASGSWKTGSGLLDDFDFSIEEAWFGKNEKFGEAPLLHLRGIAEQEVEGEMVVVDDEQVLLYGCGDGWEIQSGGTEVSHGAGKTVFINSTNMGRLIDALVDLGGDVLEELSSRGESYEAETWVGLKLHIERKQFSFTNRKTDEVVNYEVPLPTEYLGTFDPSEEEKPKAKKKSRGSKAKGGSKSKAKSGGKKGGALRKAVVEFASEYEDHTDFIEDVFDPDEFDKAEDLQADEELSADVLDEDGKVWTEAQEG